MRTLIYLLSIKKNLKTFNIIFFSLFIIGCNKNNNKILDKTDNLSTPNNIKYDTIIRNQLIEKGIKFYSENQMLKFYKISKELEINSLKIKDSLGIIYASTNLGLYFSNKFLNDSAYYYFSDAEKYSIITKKNPFLATILVNKANILWIQKNYAEAETSAIKGLKIAKEKKRPDLEYTCYITIANSLEGMNKNIQAIAYYNKALNILENDKIESNQSYKAQTLNYLANIYQKLNQHKKAIYFANKGFKYIPQKQKNINVYCYLTNILAYSKFKLGDKNVYKDFQETLKIGDSLQFAPIQITTKTYLGEFYLKEKDTIKANFYLQDAQIKAHKNNIFEDELKILQLLATSNPKEGSFYSKRYIQLNDSLQNVERTTRDKYARIEFETDEINSQNKTIVKEKDSLQNQLYFIVGIALLSILLLVLWFKNRTQKAKTRELLLKQEQLKDKAEVYQLMLDQQQKIEEGKNIEKKRISQDLHDNVMSKLNGIRLNLYVALHQNNLAENEFFIAQLDEIQDTEKEIRAIAHNLNSNVFANDANFLMIVNELFTKIKNHSQIQFTFQVGDSLNWDVVPSSIKINLYRVLQEAIQNIEKYANAKNVAVTMSLPTENEIVMTISDDGNGFDSTKKPKGIGLKNMKMRMKELNGTFIIKSSVGKGTKINLKIPI